MKKMLFILVLVIILVPALSGCNIPPTYWKNASQLCKAYDNFDFDNHGACVSWFNTETTYNKISHVCQDYDAVGNALGQTFENTGQCVKWLKDWVAEYQ
jgi:hypothetical protein